MTDIEKMMDALHQTNTDFLTGSGTGEPLGVFNTLNPDVKIVVAEQGTENTRPTDAADEAA